MFVLLNAFVREKEREVHIRRTFDSTFRPALAARKEKNTSTIATNYSSDKSQLSCNPYGKERLIIIVKVVNVILSLKCMCANGNGSSKRAFDRKLARSSKNICRIRSKTVIYIFIPHS